MNEHKVLIGNSFDLIKTLDDKSIDCVMTSPPYWGLRDYGHPDQLGQEETPEEFINKLVSFFDDVKEKLKDKGTCWINLGDSYSNSGGSGNNPENHKQFGKVINQGTNQKPKKVKSLPSKCACMIPERFAWTMIEHGWILRNKIIWHKLNHMPESVTDRFTKSYEHVFFFVKQGKYDFDLDVIRESHKTTSGNTASRKITQAQTYSKTSCFSGGDTEYHSLGKNPGDVWEINTSPYPNAHFAVFPIELVKKPILSGCPENGFVLDPFGGSGTVAEFCSQNNRNSITFELNEDYKQLIEKRLNLKEVDEGVYKNKTFSDW